MLSILKDKEVVLGVTGGIAAYKAIELLRLLIKAEAKVSVIMTKSACQFVTPLTLQTLSGRPVHTEMFDLLQEMEIGHISLADKADLLVVAPATANSIGKVANGIADDLLSTVIMATKAPVLFASAMNVNMYDNPIYQENQWRLKSLGYHFIEPATGYLACGWEGKGKLPEPSLIANRSASVLTQKDLKGKTVLVTAGPTREEIDPVRYISNYSSGKMGYAIAETAAMRGAKVILVSGPTNLSTCAEQLQRISVNSAEEMLAAVQKHQAECDIIIKAAAVADYKPKDRADEKIKKGGSSKMNISLTKNPDILATLGKEKRDQVLIGFAAESENLVANAESKLKAKNCDMIVANDITAEGAGFDIDTNIAKLLFADGKVEDLPQMSKVELAGVILDRAIVING